MKASAAVPSPCISVCTIDEGSGWCRGCLRTIDEITAWVTMGDERRSAVWRELDARRIALPASALAAPAPAPPRRGPAA